MLQNWDAFFKWFILLTDKISLSQADLNELSEIRHSCDRDSYHTRRRIFCAYTGLLISSIFTDLLGCSVPKFAGIIGCSRQRLYRIENGQVIQGIYEIFCILYAAGLPFPPVFDYFVSERLALLRKHLTSDMCIPKSSEIQETDTSDSSPKDIIHEISEAEDTNAVSIGLFLPAGNLLYDTSASSQNLILNVVCSKDGEISLRLRKALTTDVHCSDSLSHERKISPLRQSEERTIQKKSGIRDIPSPSLEEVPPNNYLGPMTPKDKLNTGGNSCKKHLQTQSDPSI